MIWVSYWVGVATPFVFICIFLPIFHALMVSYAQPLVEFQVKVTP